MGIGIKGWETSREQDERRRREAGDCARLAGAVEGLAKTRDGLFFLKWLLFQSRTLSETPVLPHENMAFLEGQRSVGLRVLQLCKMARCLDAVCADEEGE